MHRFQLRSAHTITYRNATKLYASLLKQSASLDQEPEVLYLNMPSDAYHQRRVFRRTGFLSWPKAVCVHPARNNAQPIDWNAEHPAHVLRVRVRDGDHSARCGRTLRQIRRRFAADIVTVGRERERHTELLRPIA